MKVICNRYNSFRTEKKGINSGIVILIRQTLEEKELNKTCSTKGEIGGERGLVVRALHL